VKIKDIEIGKYYRLKDTPTYGYIKTLQILKPKELENNNNFVVVKCEHTVNKDDTIGFIRYFRLVDIIPNK